MAFQITEDLMKHILQKTQDPYEVSNKINLYTDIHRGLLSLTYSRESAYKAYQEKLEEIKKEQKKLRSNCDHPLFSYHGDPAGGSDSFHSCDICGWEW